MSIGIEMSKKRYHLQADQIKPLLKANYGGCFATDMITVEGSRVGFMYRQEREFKVDSGWRFMAGMETQEYLDDAENIAIYDVNTIANYDPEIVPFLDAPVGSAFERDKWTNEFIEIDYDPEE
jgi:hypothetical protein